jgi:hypothetical protein
MIGEHRDCHTRLLSSSFSNLSTVPLPQLRIHSHIELDSRNEILTCFDQNIQSQPVNSETLKACQSNTKVPYLIFQTIPSYPKHPTTHSSNQSINQSLHQGHALETLHRNNTQRFPRRDLSLDGDMVDRRYANCPMKHSAVVPNQTQSLAWSSYTTQCPVYNGRT